ncbi:hypothetical protein [Aquitalea pelogenes]|uniref:hypothetical protein n=1 Tax=Aquitalea pelogenes TaxID=1293573 RepID=UPI0035B3C0D6
MIKRGDKIGMTNPRTGLKQEATFLIASDFQHPREFSKYLAEIYLNNYNLFREYAIHLFEYLKDKDNNLSELDVMENKSIVHGVNGFYFARDKEIFEQQEKEQKEFCKFFNKIIDKKKG